MFQELGIYVFGITPMLTSLPVNVSSPELDGQKENNHGKSDYQACDKEYEQCAIRFFSTSFFHLFQVTWQHVKTHFC